MLYSNWMNWILRGKDLTGYIGLRPKLKWLLTSDRSAQLIRTPEWFTLLRSDSTADSCHWLNLILYEWIKSHLQSCWKLYYEEMGFMTHLREYSTDGTALRDCQCRLLRSQKYNYVLKLYTVVYVARTFPHLAGVNVQNECWWRTWSLTESVSTGLWSTVLVTIAASPAYTTTRSSSQKLRPDSKVDV